MSANFNFIARYYNFLSGLIFGKSIHKAQLFYINQIPDDAIVLIVGGGSGKFLYDFLLRKRVNKILYVESSAEMLRLSEAKIKDISHRHIVEFRSGTHEDI